jgi:AsmA protein
MKSTWIRKLLIGVGVFVLLIAAALTYLVATFDANAYKGLAIDWMKTNRDRTLVISGPIKLSVFPRLAVQVSGVSLSEKGKADTFLALDEASLSVDVLPLLRKQVVVDRVSARGLRVSYLRNDKGVANIDDLVTPSAPAASAPASAPAPSSSGAALRFDVSGIQLDDLRLKLRDDKAKLAGDVTLKSLSTGRLADQAESPIKLDAQLALTSPAVQGELTGSTLLTLDMAAKGLKLRDMQLAWKGNAPGAQAVSATLRGALALDGDKGTVQADNVELSGDATLGTLKLANSTLGLGRFAYDPANKALLLSKLRVKVAGTSGGNPLSLELDWPELSVKGETLSGSALSGQASLQGPTAIEASFKTAAPSGSFERIVVPNIESTIKGRSGPRQIGGTVKATVVLQPDKGALALDGLDTQLQVQEPSLQPLQIAIQGKADATAQAAHWALKGQINANPFTSEGEAILATTPLTLNVTARFATLDLNRLLPPSAATASAPQPTNTGPAVDAPVDLSPLRSLQGKFDVRVGQFAYQTYRVSDFVLLATLEGGMLRVTQLAGKAWGGALNATAFADARASRVSVNATANGVNVNALLKDVAKKDVLEGTGRVTLDVDTAGRSVNELKSRLKGTAALQLRDGAIKGVNLAKSLRQAKATLGMKQSDEKQKASQTEKTDFSELTASFNIADGVARNTDLDAKSPFFRLGGDGALDIGKGQIDYTVRATVASTTKGQDGADLAALKGLTIPVHLSGPFEAMDWRIQWSAIAAQAIKTEVGAQVKDKLKEKLGLPSAASGASGTSDSAALKDAAKDKLKEKLKGLFK